MRVTQRIDHTSQESSVMRTLIIAAAAALCCRPRPCEAATDACATTVPQDRLRCFVARNLTLAAMPLNVDKEHPLYTTLSADLTMVDPRIHCDAKNYRAYREAAACAVNVSKLCYDPSGSLGNIMSADKVTAGMQVLCDKRQDIDMECYKNFYIDLYNCFTYHRYVSTYFTGLAAKDIICAQEDLKYDCMAAILSPMCGARTTAVFLEQLDLYTLPPSCEINNRPSRNRTRFFFTLAPPALSVANLTNNNNDSDNGSGPMTESVLGVAILLLLISVLC